MDDYINSVNKAMEIIELFSTCSGLSVNFDKKSFIKSIKTRGCNGRNRTVVGYTTTYAISAYHHY